MKFITTQGTTRLQPYSEEITWREVGLSNSPAWFHEAWFANSMSFVIKRRGAFALRKDRTRILWTKWTPFVVIRYVPKFNRFDAMTFAPNRKTPMTTDVEFALEYHFHNVSNNRHVSQEYVNEMHEAIKAWMYTVSNGQFDPHHVENADMLSTLRRRFREDMLTDTAWMVAAQFPMLRSKYGPQVNEMPATNSRFLKYPDPKVAMNTLFGKRWIKPMMKTLLEHPLKPTGYKVMQGMRKLHPLNQIPELFEFVINDEFMTDYYALKSVGRVVLHNGYHQEEFDELDAFWTSLSDARRIRIIREENGFYLMKDALRMVHQIRLRGHDLDISRYRTGEEMHNMAYELYNAVTAEERAAARANAIGLYRAPVVTNEEIDQDPYKALMSVEFPEQIKLIPPKDTDTMMEWGNMFNFCIGSYRQEALNGELFFAVEYQGNLIGCGHLRGKTLVQMLAKYNQNMPDNVVKAIVGELQFNDLMNDNVSGWGLNAVRSNTGQYANDPF